MDTVPYCATAKDAPPSLRCHRCCTLEHICIRASHPIADAPAPLQIKSAWHAGSGWLLATASLCTRTHFSTALLGRAAGQAHIFQALDGTVRTRAWADVGGRGPEVRRSGIVDTVVACVRGCKGHSTVPKTQ